ncbi:DUF2812 domain-containing protein [uncultured Dysosmobacter sp.]|uniref:DUF2812 domain-containing protein n=1 Tax=uncultured Dysosmobacter sp. TaxID=2591384 RepID=UPI002625EA8E|nr:DUF2812 domain-containing protein [uncultured Dysosmobacter sp.]
MKDQKRELPMFSFYNYTAIQRHLEKRAREGWRLIKAERGQWLYRRMEPKELHYAVVYFPDSSQFDPGPTEGQQTLRDYCLAAGWEPVTGWGQAQIYCSPLPDPVPIETEPSIQLDTIHRTMRKNFLPGELALLALMLFQLWMQAKDFYWDTADYLSSPHKFTLLILIFLGSLVDLADMLGYARWYFRSKRSIAGGGGCVPATGHPRLIWGALGLMTLVLLWQLLVPADAAMAGFMILYLAGMAGIIWSTWHLQSALKRRKFSRSANRAVTVTAIVLMSVALMAALTAGLFTALRSGVGERPPAETYEAYGDTWNIYRDEIPLRVEDLMETDYDGWSTEADPQSTPLASLTEYTQRARLSDQDAPQDLEYAIIRVKLPLLRGIVERGLLRHVERFNDRHVPELLDEYRPADASAWDAERVYQLHVGGDPRNRYLVCWPDRMAEIHFYWEPTPAQIAIAAEKLKNA